MILRGSRGGGGEGRKEKYEEGKGTPSTHTKRKRQREELSRSTSNTSSIKVGVQIMQSSWLVWREAKAFACVYVRRCVCLQARMGNGEGEDTFLSSPDKKREGKALLSFHPNTYKIYEPICYLVINQARQTGKTKHKQRREGERESGC